MQVMADRKEVLANLIVDEMGKPITQARGEIDKSIMHVKYYHKMAAEFLENEHVDMMHGGRGMITV